jgi:transcriptional regulator with XRE-family HTH domain
MSEREAFGPNLRRLRLQRGVSLQQLAESTKVSESLWAGLERNDFSRWPTGIYARAFVREYATAIGLDPETTVDTFCRWFPQGDRRVEPIIRGQAEIVGHDKLEWRDRDHVSPQVVPDGDRRGSSSPNLSQSLKKAHGPFAALRRVLGRA